MVFVALVEAVGTGAKVMVPLIGKAADRLSPLVLERLNVLFVPLLEEVGTGATVMVPLMG